MAYIIGHNRYARESYPGARPTGPQGPQGPQGPGGAAATAVLGIAVNVAHGNETLSPFVYTTEDDPAALGTLAAGVFTVAADGKYVFTYVFLDDTQQVNFDCELFINGASYGAGIAGLTDTPILSGSGVADLTAGDTVQVDVSMNVNGNLLAGRCWLAIQKVL
jgi:hypothetical protein